MYHSMIYVSLKLGIIEKNRKNFGDDVKLPYDIVEWS